MAYKKKINGKLTQGGSGRWKKGCPPPNPKGRPKGSMNRFSIAGLVKAIKSVEDEKKEAFMIAWLESAWGNASDMTAVMNYLLPRLRSIEGLVVTYESSMTDDIAKAIQDKLKEKYVTGS